MTDNIKEQKTKTLHRTDLTTQAPLNTGAELRCVERDNSSCYISAMSCQSVLFVKETRENHRPAASLLQTISHNVVTSIPRH
jgi:hypothetical protein